MTIFRGNWRKVIQIATGMRGIANLRGGEQASEGENSKRNLKEITGIDIGIEGIGNLRGGQQASEGESLKGN